jgi:protein-tyrosine phosphatase
VSAPPNDVFEAVFVCTGNRARSPLAEAFFRRHVTGLPVTTRSFGTSDVGSAPALPFAIEAGCALGIDLTGHTAHPLRPGALAHADLVVGFEPFHVTLSVVEGGADRSRTFLLRELVELLDEPWDERDPLSRPRSAVADADAMRSHATSNAAAFSIADPLHSSAREMLRAATEIDELVQRLVGGLFGRRS